MKTKDKHVLIVRRVKISFVAMLSLMIFFTYLPIGSSSSDHFPGKVFYVSTTGSDQNAGTVDEPWRTIQYAANMLKPGETVLVRGGKYEEAVKITTSGSATAGYITFQAYPGETPVIDVAKVENVEQIVQLIGAHYIVFDGFELTGLVSDRSSDYLAGIKVTKSGSNLHILNNHIHDIANTNENGNANGIIIYGNGTQAMTDITIAGNEIHDMILGWSETVSLDGNIDGFTISNNIIYNVNNIGIDILGHYNTCSNPCIDQARNGVVSDNKVYNVDTINNPAYGGERAAAAIYVDGGTDTIIERNEVYGSNFGIELASEKFNKATSNIVVRNNFIHNNQQSGLIMGGSSKSNGLSINNIVMNNTFYNNNRHQTGDGEITFQNYVNNNVFYNNVFYTDSETPFFYDGNTGNNGNVVDYNMYYATGTLSSFWRVSGAKYTSFEKYVEATKRDAHSIYADPLFYDVENGDISLQPQSPAIDAGTIAYGIDGALDYMTSQRIVGATIDLCAVEYQSNYGGIPSLIPTSTPTPNASTSIPPDASKPIDTSKPIDVSKPIDASKPIDTSKPIGEVKVDIAIDGVVEDWKQFSELANSSSNVKSLKGLIANDTLYVLVTGDLLSKKGQLYIDTGSSNEASFAVPHWLDRKANYLVEDGSLYQYSGKGNDDWSWSKVSNYNKNNTAIYSSAVEMSIPLSLLNASNSDLIKIGYIWNDSRSDQLPLGGKMASVTTTSLTLKPSSTKAPSDLINVDGKVQDWSGISASTTSSGNLKSVKVINDTKNLYVLIEGTKLDVKAQIYFNSDDDVKTGYLISNWTTAGIDHLLENGKLYSYSGNGKSWSFKKLLTLSTPNEYNSSASVIEMAIPLKTLAITAKQTIKLGILLDDSSSKKLPSSGDMISYTIQ